MPMMEAEDRRKEDKRMEAFWTKGVKRKMRINKLVYELMRKKGKTKRKEQNLIKKEVKRESVPS